MKQAEELIAVAEKAVNYRQQALKVEKDKKVARLNIPIDILQAEADLAKSQADLYGAKQSHLSILSDVSIGKIITELLVKKIRGRFLF